MSKCKCKGVAYIPPTAKLMSGFYAPQNKQKQMKLLLLPDGSRKRIKSIDIDVHLDDDNGKPVKVFLVRINKRYNYKAFYRVENGTPPLDRAHACKESLLEKIRNEEVIEIMAKNIFHLPLDSWYD